MSLKDDVSAAANEWGTASWKVRVLLVLGVLLSASSLASLADTVFQWKGFLLRGLEFYRAYVAAPLANLVTSLVGKPLTQVQIDAVVLFALFFGALMRIEAMQPISPARRIARILAQVFLFALCVAFVALPVQDGTTVWLAYPGFVLAVCLLVRGRERVQAVIFMVAPALLVAIAAAVSEGISR